MLELSNSRSAFARRWGGFFIKAVVVIGIVALLSSFMPLMPASAMAIVWAVLSAVASLGVAYPLIMKKTLAQPQYKQSSALARLNAGRMIRLIISFVLASFLMVGLLFESQKWDFVQWLTVFCAAPLYLLVTLIVETVARRQYTPMFQTRGIIFASGVITGLLLMLIYAAMLYASPEPAIPNLASAYLSVKQPFAGSDSVILAEFGKLTALGDAATEFVLSQTAEVYQPTAIIVRVVTCAAAFFGVSTLLGLCSLNKNEIKRIFSPSRR